MAVPCLEERLGSTQGTRSGAALENDLLPEVWSSEPSEREDGSAVLHAVAASSLLSRDRAAREGEPQGGGEDVVGAALALLISLFRGERAFLFEMGSDGRPADDPGAARCLASRDLDGEPVNQPERKVGAEILAHAARTRLPASAQPALDGEGVGLKEERADRMAARAIALPIDCAEGIQAVLYIENRFQALEVTRETLRLALVHARVLGAVLDLRRLREVNASLWRDVAQLREKPGAAAPRAPASRPRERARAQRTDLKGDYSLIIGSSPRMLEIFQILDRISGSTAPVLINGESGTGKELIAHAVHENSPRRGKVFVSENCGALTETLLESELFGYVKGAFTGAGKDHKGLFELAEGGTLFLDEVGDMSPTMQKKLLRVLQEGVIRRVGGKDYIPVDARIISATNKDLLEEVRSGNFREDLYYRLNVINLKCPPLRDRKEDIPELVDHFLAEMAREGGVEKRIEPPAMERLMAHSWPGNIRELRNEIKRLHALSDGDIRVEDLSEGILRQEPADFPFRDLERQLSHLTLKDATERLEKEMIRSALIQARGNKSVVAKMLQVPKTSLYNKINKYGFDKL
jgi:DNA-binding NtrC family response regulator